MVALLLSAAAHLALGLALASGQRGGPAATAGDRHPRALTVYLDARATQRFIPVRPHEAARSPANPAADRPSDQPGPEAGRRHSAPLPHPAEAALAAPPDPYYYGPGELSEKPRVSRDIDPSELRVLPDQFSQPARAHLFINEFGEVDRVVIEDSFLSAPAERFVTETLARLRFVPGRLGGNAVKSRLPIEVNLQRATAATSPHPAAH